MRALALLFCISPALTAAEVPAKIKEAVDKADAVVLYSLNPKKGKEKPKEAFESWPVLGKVKLEGATRKAALLALKSALEGRPKNGARCFIPRHGLAITHGKKELRLVICFECYWVEAFGDGKKETFTIARAAAAAFNKWLKEAKVPLPEGPASKE